MTVSELIELLKEMPAEARVRIASTIAGEFNLDADGVGLVDGPDEGPPFVAIGDHDVYR